MSAARAQSVHRGRLGVGFLASVGGGGAHKLLLEARYCSSGAGARLGRRRDGCYYRERRLGETSPTCEIQGSLQHDIIDLGKLYLQAEFDAVSATGRMRQRVDFLSPQKK